MGRLETVDAGNWEPFVASPAAVLVLAKSDCGACKAWGEELEQQLGAEGFWPEVRFGKLTLDQGSHAGFKRANPWLRELTDLPYTVIYVRGERLKAFAGAGIGRLENRLRAVVPGASPSQGCP
jgi:hypothetical protein